MRTDGTTAVVAALAMLLVLLAGCGDGGTDVGSDVGSDAGDTAQPSPTGDPGDGGRDDGGDTAQPSAAGDPGERRVVDVSTLDGDDCPQDTADAAFPDVVGATFTPVDGETGSWQVAATLCSLYDTPSRYADAWRVVTPDGEVLGTRDLLHDHAGEQPFTRSLVEPVTVPEAVSTVVVEARDQANGWGGATLEVDLSDS